METIRLPYNVHVAGKNCQNSNFPWHKVDGYCKECKPSGFSESNEQIQARRNARGYR